MGKPINKIMEGLFSLFSSSVFKNKSVHNVKNIKYLQTYLRDKNVFIDTERNVIYIEKNEKPMYKITIEKL